MYSAGGSKGTEPGLRCYTRKVYYGDNYGEGYHASRQARRAYLAERTWLYQGAKKHSEGEETHIAKVIPIEAATALVYDDYACIILTVGVRSF